MRTLFIVAITAAAACAAGDADETGATTSSTAASSGSGGQIDACTNGTRDGAESDVDCGGVCPTCEDGRTCNQASDCRSGVCENDACAPPACDDGLINGNETDVDCGGDCPECAVCLGCDEDADCETGLCQEGLCGPTIHVISAVYAGNCGAPTPVPTIVAACDKKQTCSYLFNYTVDIGYDPAYGCYKDLKVDYECSGGTTVKTYYESCAPCDPQNTPTMINLMLRCQPCLGLGEPPA